MKKNKIVLIFCISMGMAYANQPTNIIIAKNPNTIQNQLKAPSLFVFPFSVVTVGQAINQILLSSTQFKLSKDIPYDIHLQLNRKLPMHLRRLGPMSVYQAIQTLTGAQIFVVTPSTKTISFSYDSKLSDNDLKVQLANSGLEKYLNRTNYTLRVANNIKNNDMNSKSSPNEIKTYAAKNHVYFSFNDKDEIVAIANTQKEANFLSYKKRRVFYALSGQTLKETIARWSSYDNKQLYYNTDQNMRIDQTAIFYGDLSYSLSQLLKATSIVGVNLKASFTSNNALVIAKNHYSSILLSGDTIL